ncbi:MAG: hypothetical protein RLZZ546_1414 [Bacteroidota bacterium]
MCIFSDSYPDETIDVVSDFIKYKYKKDVIIIFDIASLINKLHFSADTSYWFYKYPDISNLNQYKVYSKEISTYLLYFENQIKFQNTCLGSFDLNLSINKLIILELAKECGIDTPNFFILSKGKEISEKIKSNPNIKYISKALFNWYHLQNNDELFVSGNPFHLDEIDELKVYLPSMIQEYIDKEFEIRTIFIKPNFFSMLIDSKGNLDYRVSYETNFYSRIKLPLEIESKLSILLEKIKCDFCSIDLIYSKSKKFYFLEINPSGQFAWLEKNCNYGLYDKIANYLTQS